MITLGGAARRLGVGHQTIREYLTGIGPQIEDNLNATLSKKQCKKVFLKFVSCECHEIEILFKEFLAVRPADPKQYGRIETEVPVATIPTHFESNRRKH